MAVDFDIGIVGSGFGGSLMALIATRLDKKVLLIEKGKHPRFAIGESSTPIANLVLEDLIRRWDLPRLRALTKWGSWQREHPQLPCGLKRGFSFFHHHPGEAWQEQRRHTNELLVAASPRNEIADTHWYRPSFDEFLVNEAIREGVEYLDQTQLEPPAFSGDTVALSGVREGKPIRLKVRYLIDASGPGGFLQSTLKIPAGTFPTLPPTQGLYNHFEGVRPFEEIQPPKDGAPYPVDDAAVHHVFPGGWIWVLRFNNGITSAGVAATTEIADRFDFARGEKAWEQLLSSLPSVREQFASAKAVQRFVHAPKLSWRTSRVSVGPWVMLPHTAGFVDPLLSTGIALNLLGIERLAETVGLNNRSRAEARIAEYSRETLEELDLTALIVSALYAHMGDFEVFSAIGLLYFAAAVYSETLRRLGRPSRGFLLHRDKDFGGRARKALTFALNVPLPPLQREQLLEELREVIEPIDLGGFTDAARQNWFPVRADDLLSNARKIDASEAELQELLRRTGFVEQK